MFTTGLTVVTDSRSKDYGGTLGSGIFRLIESLIALVRSPKTFCSPEKDEMVIVHRPESKEYTFSSSTQGRSRLYDTMILEGGYGKGARCRL